MMGSLLLLLIGMTSYSLASVWYAELQTIECDICLRLRGLPFRLHCLLVPHMDGVINYTWQPKYLTISLLVLVSVLKTFTSTLRHLPNVPVQMLTWFFLSLTRTEISRTFCPRRKWSTLFVYPNYCQIIWLRKLFQSSKASICLHQIQSSKFKHLLVNAKSAGSDRPLVQNFVSWRASKISIYPWRLAVPKRQANEVPW